MGLNPRSSRGFTPVSCVLVRSALDVHTAATYPLKWTSLVDNEWDFNALTALPSGLGLTALFDGTSETLVTTEAGVWAFSLNVSWGAADVLVRGELTGPFAGFSTQFGPNLTTAPGVTATGIFALPAGASSSCAVIVATGSAANPYNVTGSLAITRLA